MYTSLDQRSDDESFAIDNVKILLQEEEKGLEPTVYEGLKPSRQLSDMRSEVPGFKRAGFGAKFTCYFRAVSLCCCFQMFILDCTTVDMLADFFYLK